MSTKAERDAMREHTLAWQSELIPLLDELDKCKAVIRELVDWLPDGLYEHAAKLLEGEYPEGMWYLDCYCPASLAEFPVNTYYHESLGVVIGIANSILGSTRSGITEVRILKGQTRGVSPMRIKPRADPMAGERSEPR